MHVSVECSNYVAEQAGLTDGTRQFTLAAVTLSEAELRGVDMCRTSRIEERFLTAFDISLIRLGLFACPARLFIAGDSGWFSQGDTWQ